MIQTRDVNFAYPRSAPLFDRFSWSVARGETWAVLGASGCGKSTLLMLLAGLLRPQAGEIHIGDALLTRPRPRTGLILQEYGLLPWATVRQNAALGLDIRRFYGPDGRHAPADERLDDAAARVEAWLARLGITEIAGQYPGQISGGQRQRTAIARTLALNPDLLLMDEPFSSLDAPTREGLQTLTLDLCAEHGLTVILVTHAIEEATFVGQKILLLHPPPIQQAIVIENPHAPADAYRRSAQYQAICAQLRVQLG